MRVSESESQEGLNQEPPVSPGSGEMEHGAFLWVKTSKEERLTNVRADAGSMQMPKRR